MEHRNLQPLLGPGISAAPEDLGPWMARNMIHCEVRISRARCVYALGRSAAVTGKLNEEDRKFLRQHGIGEKLRLVPPELEKDINRVEKLLRALIPASGFVPRDQYPALKERFTALREEYLNAGAAVAGEFPRIVSSFQEGLHAYAQAALPEEQAAREEERILARLPSPEEYRAALAVRLEISEFPGIPALTDELSQDLVESWKDKVVETASGMIADTMGEAWQLLGSATRSLRVRGTISPKTLGAMARLGASTYKNVFGNPQVAEVQRLLGTITGQPPLEREAAIQTSLVEVWKYARETGLPLDPDVTPFSGEELDCMAEMAGLA